MFRVSCWTHDRLEAAPYGPNLSELTGEGFCDATNIALRSVGVGQACCRRNPAKMGPSWDAGSGKKETSGVGSEAEAILGNPLFPSPRAGSQFYSLSSHHRVDPMAAQQSQGIQTLLEAEKEAAKIVQQARQYRVQKLKDARAEASKEIEEYKKAKEQEFKSFEASHAGATSTTQAALDKETEVKLKDIQVIFNKKKDEVVDTLLQKAILVHPELHRNLKKLNA